jgi:CRISPR-associated protein Csb2
MTSYLCLSVAFLDPEFHGRRDGGELEWPPSPLRLFQALVGTSAARWGERQHLDHAAPALTWLASQPPPIIVAPPGVAGSPYRLSVPNNAMDIVAKAWGRGNETGKGDANPATHRTMKTVRPTRLVREEPVSYLWELPADPPADVLGHVEVLSVAARQVFALGWGVDLVAGNGRVLTAQQADALPGDWWRPTGGHGAVSFRVPVEGTLAALADRHERFLGRLSGDGFTPVPPLTAFREVGYQRDTEPVARPFAAFQLLTLDAGGFQPYSSTRQTVAVAGMVRHTIRTAARAAGWSQDRIATFVLGHGDGPSGQARGARADSRFIYLPLPTIEERKTKDRSKAFVVGSIRRVLVAGPADAIAWARRALSGRELNPTDDRTRGALLSLIPESDGRLRHYVGTSAVWSTVTPVVLPGYDDAQSEKTERLLRKAIEQAGFSGTLARHAGLEWRRVGFLPGLDPATGYDPPAHLRGHPKYHVRLHWRDTARHSVPVRGPIVIGAGRYYGLGLFVAAG